MDSKNRLCDNCNEIIWLNDKRMNYNDSIICSDCYDKITSQTIKEAPTFDDGRHHITDRMIEGLKEVAYNQDDFGMNKYKKPLKAHYHYDWLKMAKEELVDLGKYLECENERKNVVIQLIELAIQNENWEYVKNALTELKKDGTDK